MITNTELEARLQRLKDEKLGVSKTIEILTEQNSKLNADIQRLMSEVSVLDSCATFFNKTIELKVDEVSTKIEDIINKGLAYIYSADYKFKLNKSIKRNKTTFSFELINIETGVSGFSETYGGGIMALISFLFRIVVLAILNKPRLIMLDETLSAVSIEYQEKLSTFIKQIADDMGFTIIIISHQPTLAEKCNLQYIISKSGGLTKINQIIKVKRAD